MIEFRQSPVRKLEFEYELSFFQNRNLERGMEVPF